MGSEGSPLIFLHLPTSSTAMLVLKLHPRRHFLDGSGMKEALYVDFDIYVLWDNDGCTYPCCDDVLF